MIPFALSRQEMTTAGAVGEHHLSLSRHQLELCTECRHQSCVKCGKGRSVGRGTGKGRGMWGGRGLIGEGSGRGGWGRWCDKNPGQSTHNRNFCSLFSPSCVRVVIGRSQNGLAPSDHLHSGPLARGCGHVLAGDDLWLEVKDIPIFPMYRELAVYGVYLRSDGGNGPTHAARLI